MIRVTDIHKRYGDLEVLKGVSLEVAQGEVVSIVGASGAGKTTLCNLIPRFYDVTGGCIRIDGQDIRTLTQKSLREAIGMVQQEVYLFAGSVLENIAYGKPGASRAEVEEAAKLAGAHEFISALPHGYDTYVGERGVRLSGGQKRRTALLRALWAASDTLLLDEPFTGMDPDTLAAAAALLRERCGEKPVLLATHDREAIRLLGWPVVELEDA